MKIAERKCVVPLAMAGSPDRLIRRQRVLLEADQRAALTAKRAKLITL